jgi:carboxylate-amine ligase
VADAGAVVGVAHALVAWLCERFDAGEELGCRPTWEIEEDRWLALRHGAQGPLAPRVRALLDALEPVAERLGGAGQLAEARLLAEDPGHARQRAAAERGGARAAAAWLADAYDED